MSEYAKKLRDIEAENARRLYEAESDYLIAAADYIERLEAINAQLVEACELAVFNETKADGLRGSGMVDDSDIKAIRATARAARAALAAAKETAT